MRIGLSILTKRRIIEHRGHKRLFIEQIKKIETFAKIRTFIHRVKRNMIETHAEGTVVSRKNVWVLQKLV